MRFGTILTVGALVLGLAVDARATTLFAGPLRVDNGLSTECALVVVGKKDIKEVVITNNLDFPGPEQSTFAVLSPGDQAAVINVNNQANPLPSWYKFEFSGSRRSVSATMCVRDAALGCSAAVSAQ